MDFCLQLKVVKGGQGGEGLSSEIHNTLKNFLPKITDFWKVIGVYLTFQSFYGIVEIN